MQEVDPDETRTGELMWLTERVTTLGKEKEAMETAPREMEEKIALQEDFANNVADRCVSLEEAIKSIAEHVQRLCVFNKCVKTTLGGLVEEVKTHQGHFQEVVRVLRNHEQHIANSGAASQNMVQYINALVEENEKKRAWIGTLISEFQAQSQILRRHEMGQQVMAEVIKDMMRQQQQPQQSQGQTVTGSGPTVTDVEDDEDPDHLVFLGGPNPHKGPPNGGTGQLVTKPPRFPKRKVVAKRK